MMKSRRAGLTILEIMISMAVLAFVLLAFMSIMHSANSLSTSSKEAAIAMRDVQSAVEDTFSGTYDEFRTRFMDSPNYPVPPPVYSQMPPVQTPYTHIFHQYREFTLTNGQKHSRPLRNEIMNIIEQARDTANVPPAWIEYRIECTFSNHKGFTQTEFIVTKRSK